jgi:hypothetical protein
MLQEYWETLGALGSPGNIEYLGNLGNLGNWEVPLPFLFPGNYRYIS